MRPAWNLNVASARKLTQLDHRDTAFGNPSKIAEHIKGLQSPGDDFLWWFSVVGKPKRGGHTRRCLLSGFFCKDRCAVSALGKNDATGQTRHACANNGYTIHNQNHLRAIRRW